MATEAQKKALKKYLEGKERINTVFPLGTRHRIEEWIRCYGYYETLGEFIRDAVEDYLNKSLDDILCADQKPEGGQGSPSGDSRSP